MILLLRKRILALAAAVLCCVVVTGGCLLRRAQPTFLAEWDSDALTVVIDAGHGGEDGGAVAADGTVESAINLAVAQRLEALLRLLGYETRMTRTEDTAIYSEGAETLREKKASDLKNRVRLVNGTPNAVLLSIHQNSLPSSRSVRGAQAFYAGTEGSAALAEAIQTALNTAINTEKARSCRAIDTSVYLMKHVERPAVLIECGFLSNAEETLELQKEDYQRKLAVTVAAGFLAGRSESG